MPNRQIQLLVAILTYRKQTAATPSNRQHFRTSGFARFHILWLPWWARACSLPPFSVSLAASHSPLAAAFRDPRHYGFFNRDIRLLEFPATLDKSITCKFLIGTLCPFPILHAHPTYDFPQMKGENYPE
jgi:hypothetical protein